ncbi:hypothetical protein [Helicobacter canis]|uniref:hypothetical protein n=1 Tax=Helicobacter canis TaxID=29419 RepID=UPI0003F59743|nr:hypothetical protein [Helicobacter canis]
MKCEKRDSALGNHSADLVDFGATADHKSSSVPKSTKNYESNTAIPRILEESRASLRDTAPAVARQSTQTTTQVDSSMDCHALPCKARNDRKLDSTNAARRQDLR